MSSETPKPQAHQLTLDDEERTELITILERTLGETRVEAHHTHTPDYRDQVLREESVIRRLLEKLR